MHRLMIVDDEAVIAMQLEESLAAMGYEVVGTVDSGDYAVEMAKEVKPDLILMDIVMPGELDGIAASEMIRAQLGIPVIFLTAHAQSELIERAKRAEPLGYVVKPFHETELKAVIEVALYKKEAERRLRETEEKLSEILASLPQSLTMVDEQHNIVWTNEVAGRWFGSDLVGEKCYTVYRRRDEPCESCPATKCFQNGQTHEDEVQVTKADGNKMTLRCITNVGSLHMDGRPRTVVVCCRDITERKRMEEEKRQREARLQQAQKMEEIGTLAGGIAHDFNDLLMGIQGNVSSMLMDVDSKHPHYECLKNIEKQVQSGASLTSQLLGYARKGRYQVKPVSLNQIIR